MTRFGPLLACTLILGVLPTAFAGSLYLGSPTIEDANYVFPVMLGDSDGTVAALDFRLRYDPAVFEPVGTAMGPSAADAGKQVAANTPYPGEHIVVVMGLNQSVMATGEVARVAMRTLTIPESGETALDIIDPAMSDPDGVAVAARGEGMIVPLGDAPEKPETPGKPGSKPGGNGGGTAPSPAPPARPGTQTPAPAALGGGGGLAPGNLDEPQAAPTPGVTAAELAEAKAALNLLEETTATPEALEAPAQADMENSNVPAQAPEGAADLQGAPDTAARIATAALDTTAKTVESPGETAQHALGVLAPPAPSSSRLPWPLIGVLALMLALLGIMAAVRSRLFR